MDFDKHLGKTNPTFLLSLVNTVIRITLYYLGCQLFGFVNGTFIVFTFFFVWRQAINKIYEVKYLTFFDKMFVSMDRTESFNLGGFAYLGNFDSNRVKNAIIENLFKRIPKLSASLRVIFTEYCWNTPLVARQHQDIQKEIYLKRIKQVSLKESEVDDYIEKEANKPLDVFDAPIEFHIITITDKEKLGILYTKIDHCFSDGLGNVSLFGFLDDNFSLDKYPAILKKKIPMHLFIISQIKDYTLGLLIGIFELAYAGVILKSYYKGFSKPITTKKGKLARISCVELADIKKVSKKIGLTVNEIYIGCIFAAMKELSPESEKLSIMIPMGNTTLPETVDKIQLQNSAMAFMGVVRLISDVQKDSKILKEDIRGMVSKTYKIAALKMNMAFFFGLLNTRLIKTFIKNYPLDCVITNVPGQEGLMTIGGCPALENYSAVIPATNKCFIAIGSYNGKISVGIGLDENQPLGAKVLADAIGKKLRDLIESAKQE